MKRRLEAFRLGVVASAAAAAVLGGLPWRAPALALTLLALGVLATQFPLRVSLMHKVSAATAVFFAACLLLPAPEAAAVAAGSGVVSSGVSVLRRTVASRQLPPIRSVFLTAAFNAAQGYLAVFAGGGILALGGVRADRLVVLHAPVYLAGAALAMYCVNLGLVSVAVALGNRTDPVRAFADSQSVIAPQHAVLYAVGVAVAAFTVRFPWLPLLMVIPGALVHASLRRAVKLRQDTIRAVERMAEMVDRRDPYTYEHSRRVAEYSVQLAHRLGLSRDETELVRLAARVHDLGKIGIADAILMKPGRLTADEIRQMEEHPRIGHDILSEFHEYAKVRELVLTHHERFAGGGYPNGLRGGGLPLLAQVIPVADSLDAMTTARPYRGPLPWSVALAELAAGAGSQWNPQVVAAAVAIFAGRREAEEPVAPALVAV